MRKLICFLLLLLFTKILLAQDEKLRLAVFDPSAPKSISEDIKIIVREIISSTFVNTGMYNILERSMLQQVMQEMAFSNTDIVDESQATEIGKLAGASKIVLPVVTQAGSKNMLSIKLIDVKTATIDQQKTKLVNANELLDAIEPLTNELLGINSAAAAESNAGFMQRGRAALGRNTNQPQQVQQQAPPPQQLQQTAAPVVVTQVQQNIVSVGGEISVYFAGYSFKRNPGVKVSVDGVHVGNGTLNQGFTLSFSESYNGSHTIKLEWESTVPSKEYKIDTHFKKQFIFEYTKGGFGFEMKLKN